MREKEAGHEMLNESHAARECTEADLAKTREEIQESGVALRRLQEKLDTARRLASTLKEELERARISKASADADRVATVESCRKAETKRESRAQELRTSQEALVADRERYAAFMVETDKSRTQNELAEAAKSCAEIKVAEIRDDLRKSHETLAAERERYKPLSETLAAERERYEALSQKADASDKHVETAHRAQEGLLEPCEALAAERERFESLSQKANESEEHLKAARTAHEELEKFREALAAECERSSLFMKEVDTTRAQNELVEVAKSCAEIEVAEIRGDLRKSRVTLAAERERYKPVSQKADASDKHLETAHRAQEELRKSREALAAERERFEFLSQKANESEEHLEAARTAQEELEKIREALAAECERSALFMKKVDTTRAQNELAEEAKSCAEIEVAEIRDDLQKSRETLAAERERYEALSQKANASDKHLETAHRAQEELRKSREALAAELERFEALSQKANESEEHLEEARTAQKELQKFREALAAECKWSALFMKEVDTTRAQNALAEAAKSCAEIEVAEIRGDLRKSRVALAAGRER